MAKAGTDSGLMAVRTGGLAEASPMPERGRVRVETAGSFELMRRMARRVAGAEGAKRRVRICCPPGAMSNGAAGVAVKAGWSKEKERIVRGPPPVFRRVRRMVLLWPGVTGPKSRVLAETAREGGAVTVAGAPVPVSSIVAVRALDVMVIWPDWAPAAGGVNRRGSSVWELGA